MFLQRVIGCIGIVLLNLAGVFAVAMLHDRLYAVGGTTVGTSNNDIVCDTVEAYDQQAGKWTDCAALCDARTGLAVAPI